MENVKPKRKAESGKQKVLAGLLAVLLALPSFGADLTRSITFADGQRLTAAQLHTLIDGASIGVTFLTGKSLLGTVDSADYVLVYDTSAGTFTKMTLGTLIMANTDLITTQTDEPNPVAADYLLLYDASAAGFKKVSIANLTTANTNNIALLPVITTNALQTATVPILNGGTNAQIALGDLWRYAWRWTYAVTNLTAHTSPTNLDALVIWDSVGQSNKQVTLLGLVTNLPVALPGTSNSAVITVTETNVQKQMTLSNLTVQVAASGLFLTTNATYTSSTVAANTIVAAVKAIDAAHGLGVTPKFKEVVLVCTTSDLGYPIGDELPADQLYDTLGANPVQVFCNTTNVGVIARSAASGWQTASKVTPATFAAITPGSWALKIYARP